MDSNRLSNVATVILVACAAVVTVSTVRRDWALRGASPAALSPTSSVQDWRRYASAGHVIGSASAAITIVEFADFECPACRLFYRVLDSLKSKGADIKLVYRHFPLASHRFSMSAVRASECAVDEGLFAPMHDALFRYPDSLGVAPWWWFARTAGMRDSSRFNECLHSSAPIRALEVDTTDARRLAIRGTPLLVIENIRVDGMPSIDSLQAYIRRAHKAPQR